MWSSSSVSMTDFEDALRAGVRDVKMRVTALDSSLDQVNAEGDITPDSIEGTVYVDADRATRRTCQLRIIDTNGKYNPLGSDVSVYGTNSFFYWDKLFKIEYGLKVNGEYIYVPLGIFMVDRVEVVSERGAAVINIDGSDLWKRITFAQFSAPQVWNTTKTINEVITDFLVFTGGFVADKLILDPLTARASKLIQKPVFVETGENRGERLLELLKEWSIDIYVNRDGFIVTRDKTQPPYTGDIGAPQFEFTAGSDAIMLGVVKSQSADNIKNHIVCIGATEKVAIVPRAEAIDGGVAANSTASKYYTGSSGATTVESIGDRTLVISAPTLTLVASCLERAKQELAKNTFVDEEIRLPAIVNPTFDAYDVISIIEANSATDDSYQLTAFDIPMQGSRQEMIVRKTRYLNG
jgi:hypothetical protein